MSADALDAHALMRMSFFMSGDALDAHASGAFLCLDAHALMRMSFFYVCRHAHVLRRDDTSRDVHGETSRDVHDETSRDVVRHRETL